MSPLSLLFSSLNNPVPSVAPHKSCTLDPSQLHCHSLEMLQGLNVFILLRGFKINTILKVWPHQFWVQWCDQPGHIAGSHSAEHWPRIHLWLLLETENWPMLMLALSLWNHYFVILCSYILFFFLSALKWSLNRQLYMNFTLVASAGDFHIRDVSQ